MAQEESYISPVIYAFIVTVSIFIYYAIRSLRRGKRAHKKRMKDITRGHHYADEDVFG